MTLSNTYVLDVDLKRQMTSRTPTFKKGDNGVLIFRLFDDGNLYPIDDAVKATLNIVSPSGILYEEETLLMTYEGTRVARYVFIEDVMLESGNYSASLTLEEGNGNKVSIQPFNIVIYNDVKGGINSVMDLVRSLQDRINNLISDLNQTIKLSEKGQPNGVATLDINGRIPQSQLPTQLDSIISHINHTVWKNQVHGMRIDKDGILQYDTGNNTWQNVGFAPSAVGGGTPAPQLLDATITKSNSIATVKYTGVPTVAVQKWAVGERDKSYFVTNGTAFTGLTFPITQLGIHTLYYKDSNGVEYTQTFNVATSDLLAPTITVDINNGDVTVNISGSVSIKKWAKGKQSIGYFQSQGTVFTGNTFKVTEVGWYTIYYKATSGAEYIYQFEVDYAQLNGGLPIVVRSTLPNLGVDFKYRNFQIGINDSRAVKVKYTGFATEVNRNEFSNVLESDGYYYSSGSEGYVDVTRDTGDMIVEFMDDNNNVLGTAVHKCRVNYNYFVVNDSYISLTRIKNSTYTYTLPVEIEGLPVLDAGSVFFTSDANIDNWNTKYLIIPSTIYNGGMFAYNTSLNNTSIDRIRIESSNFKLNLNPAFLAFENNDYSGVVVEVPLNSTTYNTIRSRTHSSYVQVQTF